MRRAGPSSSPLRTLAALCGAALLAVWLLSGLWQVPATARGIAESLGRADRVLLPGLHALLPWPAARVMPVEFGTIHLVAFAAPLPLIGGGPPGGGSRPGTTASIRVLYRTGLRDQDAIGEAVRISDPAALVQAETSRAACAWAAAHRLAELDADGGVAAGRAVREAAQAALEARAAGIEVLAVAIAEVRATSVASGTDARAAATSLAAERGAAAVMLLQARQAAFARVADARATAAEIVAAARQSAAQFQVDQQSAHSGDAFLFERYLAALSGALANVPKTIVDHRLNWPEAPILDLRPPGAPSSGTEDTKQE